jgi:hypothetical protein
MLPPFCFHALDNLQSAVPHRVSVYAAEIYIAHAETRGLWAAF